MPSNVLCIQAGRIFWTPGGYFQIRRSGGGLLGPDIKFGGKSWGKVWPSSSNKRKNLGSSVTEQKLGKSLNFGVISEIQRAKFGVFVIYIFGGKIWGSNKNFRGKIWGRVPRPPDMEVPPLGSGLSHYCRRKLLNSDWLLWSRHLPNFLFDVSSNVKILNCRVL